MPERTRLARRYLFKTFIFLAVTAALALWFYLDAAVFYPRRGERDAEWARWQYLQACRGSSSTPNLPLSSWDEPDPTVADPAAALQALEARAARAESLRDIELTRARWLSSLRSIGRLKATETAIPNPNGDLATLTTQWQGSNAPKPLSPWDIPVQWMLAGVCGAVALVVLAMFLRAARLTYRWDAVAHRLTLPDGSSLVPADVAEFDKRKWDKFLVSIKVKPGHERHGDKSLRLDLYRYTPLESWVLAMEKEAFPESSPPADPTPPPAPPPTGGEAA